MSSTLRFRLDIECENAAFTPNHEPEIARLLAIARDQVMRGEIESSLYDVNGNRVGEWSLVPHLNLKMN